MSPSTITITRTVAAPAERVFTAWADAEELAAWWWPQLEGTTYDVDVRPGGRFRIHSPTVGITASGMYTEVDPPSRLAFTWHWEGDGEPDDYAGEDHVIVTFVAAGPGATEVTVAHTSTDHVEGGGAEQGWNDVMDRLAGLV